MQTRRTGAGQIPGSREWPADALIGLPAVVLFRDILPRTPLFSGYFFCQYSAFRTFSVTTLAAGRLPLWNPYTFKSCMVRYLIHQRFTDQAAWPPLIFLAFRKPLFGRSFLSAIAAGLHKIVLTFSPSRSGAGAWTPSLSLAGAGTKYTRKKENG